VTSVKSVVAFYILFLNPEFMSLHIYWYSIYLLHQVVFAGMLRCIARAAQNMARKL
jgi:hypothetical protein